MGSPGYSDRMEDRIAPRDHLIAYVLSRKEDIENELEREQRHHDAIHEEYLSMRRELALIQRRVAQLTEELMHIEHGLEETHGDPSDSTNPDRHRTQETIRFGAQEPGPNPAHRASEPAHPRHHESP